MHAPDRRAPRTPAEFPPAGKPGWCTWMPLKFCFRNAFEVATSHEDLRYAEGYALLVLGNGEQLWVHHAWVVDREGNAIDPTWRSAGLRYMGIVVDPAELVTRQVHKVKVDIFEPVLAASRPLLHDIAAADWQLAEWFTGISAADTSETEGGE